MGFDFGTLSGRAVIFSLENGEEVGEGVSCYKHGVMMDHLPNGTPLPSGYALESPLDILAALKEALGKAIGNSGIDAKDIISIGFDATTYSMVVVDENLQPMCFRDEFSSDPMAWIKLWKHHGAQKEADDISSFHARTGKLRQCERSGGVFNCEWALPKMLETFRKSPDLLKSCSHILDMGEWVVSLLVGRTVSSLYSFGFKLLWSDDLGFPLKETLNELEAGFGDILYEKLSFDVNGYESAAGFLTKEASSWLGLKEGIPVAVPMGDGSVPGVSICAKYPESIAITYGTSTAMAFMDKELRAIRGINGVVKDSFRPGYYAYDAGLPSSGDMLSWFTDGFVNQALIEKAGDEPIHSYLTRMGEQSEPYLNPLVVLDWFGGNRSIINDSSLRGVIAGLTVNTKPEEIYVAMLQSIAFSTRKAISYFEDNGFSFSSIIVMGGVADKNRFFLKQLSTILNRPILFTHGHKMTAMGAAILALVAAGYKLDEALDLLCPKDFETILPSSGHREEYEKLYKIWCFYHDALAYPKY